MAPQSRTTKDLINIFEGPNAEVFVLIGRHRVQISQVWYDPADEAFEMELDEVRLKNIVGDIPGRLVR